jgi:transcriptional regulator with XRE-family HTH domain
MCADRAGISLRNLRMIESYLSSPTLTTVQKLAAAFGCSWEDLLGHPSVTISIEKTKSKSI